MADVTPSIAGRVDHLESADRMSKIFVMVLDWEP